MNLGFMKGFALAFPVSIVAMAACGGTADVGNDQSNVNNAGNGNETGGSAGVINVPGKTGGRTGQGGAAQGGAAQAGAAGSGSSRTCGGLLGGQCAANEWCDFGDNDYCGAADATGVCHARPEACDLMYLPVCGCDGQMYGNACAANAAGTDASTDTSCFPKDGGAGGTICGGLLGSQCGADEFCDFGDNDNCGAADATGVCRPRPQACTKEYRPVCGCNGQLYGNACDANSAGTDASTDTSCLPATGSECKSDADCRLVDDYCGGCNCLSLAPGESPPKCTDPVNCFVQPCMNKTAACVSGNCVAQ
jgi:hypothetical protein